jgi:hypothetical protein
MAATMALVCSPNIFGRFPILHWQEIVEQTRTPRCHGHQIFINQNASSFNESQHLHAGLSPATEVFACRISQRMALLLTISRMPSPWQRPQAILSQFPTPITRVNRTSLQGFAIAEARATLYPTRASTNTAEGLSRSPFCSAFRPYLLKSLTRY